MDTPSSQAGANSGVLDPAGFAAMPTHKGGQFACGSETCLTRSTAASRA